MNISSLKRYKKPSYRKIRIEQTIQQIISELLLRGEIKDSILRDTSVTITHVKCSDDLKYADVFFSKLGVSVPTETEKKKLETGFGRASGFIRSRVGSYLTMHKAPELRFHVDNDLYEAERITNLVAQVNA